MSTIDRRRLLGPANAKPLVFAPIPADKLKQTTPLEEDTIEAQLRRTFIRTGLVSNANGSGYLEVDDNVVSVSVYGPRPIRGSFMERASLNVVLDDVGDVMDDLMEKKFCNYVENAFLSVINLDKYPKSGIDIFINVISVQDPQRLYLKLLSLITDVTTLALIDAGIEILDVVSSAYDYKNNTVVSFVKGDEVVGLLSESLTPLTNLKQIIDRAHKSATTVKSALVGHLVQGVKQ